MKIEGLTESLSMLRELAAQDGGAKSAKKIVRKGMRAGGKVLLAAARADCPQQSGRLVRSIKLKVNSGKGKITASVGTRAKDFTGPTFYAAFVLWGHLVGSRKLGSSRRAVAPNDFMTRALESHGDAAAQAAADSIEAQIAAL